MAPGGKDTPDVGTHQRAQDFVKASKRSSVFNFCSMNVSIFCGFLVDNRVSNGSHKDCIFPIMHWFLIFSWQQHTSLFSVSIDFHSAFVHVQSILQKKKEAELSKCFFERK